MRNKANLQEDLQITQTIGDFIQAFEEIYVLRMQRTRNSVLKTRHYMEGLLRVYNELRQAHTQQLLRQGGKVMGTASSKKPLVSVLLTTSRRLSGDINQRIFRQFKTYLEGHPESDVMIVGSLGRDLYLQAGLKTPYQFFDMGEEKLGLEQLKPVLTAILEYTQVQVFHGRFVNLVEQEVVNRSLGGQMEELNAALKQGRAFLFEPSLEALLKYFERQIVASLYKQTAHESYLAQVGSRITALELATQHIAERMKILQSQKLRLRKQARNRKQLMQYAGMSLWRK